MQFHGKFGLAFVVAFFLGFSGTAQATSYSLGSISGPGTFEIGSNKDLGAFTDNVHFVINPGVHLIFSAEVTNYTWRHGGIYDMDGTLSDASGIIANADAALVNPPYPYPARVVTFESIVLGPGHYVMSLFGNSQSTVLGAPNYYSGNIQFAATPLPAALLMMLTALGGLGFLGWRRKAH